MRSVLLLPDIDRGRGRAFRTHDGRSAVDHARHSIVCSTFNFQRSSGLWAALGAAAQRVEITMRVYVDTNAAARSSPTTEEVAAHLRPGVVPRTIAFDGQLVRNHLKFICIDHRFLLVTSANFSWSGENTNLELGMPIDNRNLAEAVEHQKHDAEDYVFERVRPALLLAKQRLNVEEDDLPLVVFTVCVFVGSLA